MKEFRFKVLRPGDSVASFSEHNLVVHKESGTFHIYALDGIKDYKPQFYKDYETVNTYTADLLEEGFAIVREGAEYKIFYIEGYEDGYPILNKKICLIISSGIGKIQKYDTETEVTIELNVKDKKDDR